jgi:hypothetical protein
MHLVVILGIASSFSIRPKCHNRLILKTIYTRYYSLSISGTRYAQGEILKDNSNSGGSYGANGG